ncbi:MAG TPA: hypothetical protein DCY07_02210 [Rhodospirillaceae bacterium]|nr:hypothetical protein [Rhodospirillaceae bacterium]
MAQVGEAKLHVNVMPLLQKRLEVVAFELQGADVQLETSPGGVVNWSFDTPKTKEPETAKAEKKAAAKADQPITLEVQKITVTKARIGIKNKEGKLSLYDVPSLTLTDSVKGTRLHFSGTVADKVTEIDMTGGRLDALMGANWPFNMKIIHDKLKIDARGSLNDNIKKITIDEYMLEAGDSKAKGQLTIALGGARPVLKGTMTSPFLDPDDLKTESESEPSSKKEGKAEKPTASSGKIFSREPLSFDALRTVDLDLALTIDELVAGMTSVKQFATKVVLNNGRLVLSPVTGTVAGSKTEGALTLDASASPTGLAFNFKAPDMDLSQLVKLGNMESAISGKSDVSLTLQTSGRSVHDFASVANGQVTLHMMRGTISQSELKSIAGSLLDLFAPGIGSLTNTGVNCIAARYKITNGLMETTGLLIDTDMTTIAGSGYINLADERINMNLHTRPKSISLGGMVPAMKILGGLSAPTFTMDTAGTVEKVAGLIMGGSKAGDGVPTLLKVPAGQNACAATLDDPAAAAAAAVEPTKPLVPTKFDAEGIKNTVKDAGDKLLKGLGNGLFGQ